MRRASMLCIMSPMKLHRVNLLIGFLSLALLALPADRAIASEESGAVRVARVEVGFNGIYKVGVWTQVRITLACDQPAECSVRLATRDGDGVPTRVDVGLDQTVKLQTGETTVVRYVKFGRRHADLGVEIRFGDDVLNSTVEELPTALTSTERLMLTIGASIGVEEAVRQRVRGEHEPTSAVHIDSAADLPDYWCGYEAVETLVITSSDLSIIESLSDRQFHAIADWVRMGGRLLVCAGANGEQAFGEKSRLNVFAPGNFQRVATQRITSGVERYVVASERLEPFDMTLFGNLRGPVEIDAEIAGREPRPLVVRYPLGFGRVVFVAADLDQAPFDKWPDRTKLVSRLLRESDADKNQQATGDERGGQVTHVGYRDLTGQLRCAMDVFGGVKLVAFSWVAALIGIYILLIGPGDYFLLRKVIGRMHLSWITFPLLVLAFCGAAIALSRNLKDGQLRINQVDIVDIDMETKLLRGTTWAHVYSPRTAEYDLRLRSQFPSKPNGQFALLSWQGLAGTALGGLNSDSTTSLFDAPYLIDGKIGDADKDAEMAATPIAISGTKAVAARWGGTIDLDDHPRLTSDEHGLLEGQIRNPLPIALKEASLVFDNWSYPLNGPFAPGQIVDVKGELLPKNFQWRLQKRRAAKLAEISVPWDPSNIDDLPRILELMMFYQAAQGRSYTKLSHRFQPYVDLSGHLRTGRAILVGRAETPASYIDDGENSLAENYDSRWTIYRIVYRVDLSPRKFTIESSED